MSSLDSPKTKEDAEYQDLVKSLVSEEGWKNYFSKTSVSEMKKEVGVPVKGFTSPDQKTKTALFVKTSFQDGKLSFRVDDWHYPPYYQAASVATSLLRSVQPGETLFIEGEGGPRRPGCVYPMKTVLEFKMDGLKALFKIVDQSNPWCCVVWELDLQWLNLPRKQ